MGHGPLIATAATTAAELVMGRVGNLSAHLDQELKRLSAGEGRDEEKPTNNLAH
jgi:hypothetical protein